MQSVAAGKGPYGLHSAPDLNDAVGLDIATQWQADPWKEAENGWHELLAGKCEWSSIGYDLIVADTPIRRLDDHSPVHRAVSLFKEE